MCCIGHTCDIRLYLLTNYMKHTCTPFLVLNQRVEHTQVAAAVPEREFGARILDQTGLYMWVYRLYIYYIRLSWCESAVYVLYVQGYLAPKKTPRPTSLQ
jgi:hypothetical protein